MSLGEVGYKHGQIFMQTSPWLFSCERVQRCGVQPPALLPLLGALPPPDLRACTVVLLPYYYLDIRVVAKRFWPDIFILDCPVAVQGENGCKASSEASDG